MTEDSKTPPAGAGGKGAEPQIWFGGRWIPAHQAWARMEFATDIVNSIERFNQHHPKLSTQNTLEVVPLVRQRLREISLRLPEKGAEPIDPRTLLAELLEKISPEDAIVELRRRTGQAIDLRELISLAGDAAYIGALTREAEDFRSNSISPEQTAQIWNESGRPLPGGGLWSGKRIEEMLLQPPPSSDSKSSDAELMQ